MNPKTVSALTRAFLVELIALGDDVELSSVLRPENVLICEDKISLKNVLPVEPFVPVAGFAAPEQYVAGDCERAPVYFVGALMYTLLTGGPPPDVRSRLAQDDFLAGDQTELGVVMKHCLALRPNDRYANLSFVLTALQQVDGIDGSEAVTQGLEKGPHKKEIKPAKKSKKKILILLLVVFVLAVGFLCYTLVQGMQAEEALKAGEFERVVSILDKTPWLKSSRSQSYNYAQAMQLWKAGAYGQALQLLEGLGEYGDSAQKAQQVKYDHALALLQTRQLEEAQTLFGELGEYEDSSAQNAQITAYLQAQTLEDPLAKYEAYNSFGEYLDSRQLARDAASGVYQAAMAAYLGGDIAGAGSQFTALGNFEDAPIYQQICDIWVNASGTAADNRALLASVLAYSEVANLEPVLMSDRFFMVFLEGVWNSPDGGGEISFEEDKFKTPLLPTAGKNWAFENRSIVNTGGTIAVFGYLSPNELTMTVSASGETYTYQRQAAEG